MDHGFQKPPHNLGEAAGEATCSIPDEAAQIGERMARSSAGILHHGAKARSAMGESPNTASSTLEHAAEQFLQLLGFDGPHTKELARRWSVEVQAHTQASTVHGRGTQKDPQEVFGLVQDRLRKDIEGVTDILNSRLVQDVVADQSDPVRQRLEEIIDANRRMGALVIRIAEQMGQIIHAQASRNAN